MALHAHLPEPLARGWRRAEDRSKAAGAHENELLSSEDTEQEDCVRERCAEDRGCSGNAANLLMQLAFANGEFRSSLQLLRNLKLTERFFCKAEDAKCRMKLMTCFSFGTG
jgi:hypothetical protein